MKDESFPANQPAVLCFYVRARDHTPRRYRAIYLPERSLSTLISGVRRKFHSTPAEFCVLTFTNGEGIEAVLDEDALQYLADGQELVVDFVPLDLGNNLSQMKSLPIGDVSVHFPGAASLAGSLYPSAMELGSLEMNSFYCAPENLQADLAHPERSVGDEPGIISCEVQCPAVGDKVEPRTGLEQKSVPAQTPGNIKSSCPRTDSMEPAVQSQLHGPSPASDGGPNQSKRNDQQSDVEGHTPRSLADIEPNHRADPDLPMTSQNRGSAELPPKPRAYRERSRIPEPEAAAEKRARHLAKNRKAAAQTRVRKMWREAAQQEDFREKVDENSRLRVMVSKLQSELELLKRLSAEHSDCCIW